MTPVDAARMIPISRYRQRQAATQPAEQFLHGVHHPLRHAGLVQHQAHVDEHRQRHEDGILDYIAEQATRQDRQLLIVDAGAVEFDDVTEAAAERIQENLGEQRKDQRHADQRHGNRNTAEQHPDERQEHQQHGKFVQRHQTPDDFEYEHQAASSDLSRRT